MKPVMGVLALLICSTPALAWDCPSGQIRQQAPAGTPTTTPYYDVVEGIAFICVPTTPTATTTSAQSQNQNQNQSQSQSTKSSTNSSASSGSTSTATGGNSSVSNSGNSSNRNTNTLTANGGTATGGNASANNANNSSTTYAPVTTTEVEAPKIPVASAYAPPILPTVSCFKGYSGGVQTAPAGISFGGGKIDQNCAELETARQAPSLIARCKVYITNKYVKAAGVTLEDCLNQPPPVAVVAPSPVIAPAPAPQPIVITVAPPPIPAPVVTKTVVEIGSAPFVHQNVVNRLLDDAIANLQTDGDATLILTGPIGTYKSLEYIKSRGIDIDRVTVKLSDTDRVEAQIVKVQ